MTAYSSLAVRTIRRLGSPITLIKVSEGSYDSVTRQQSTAKTSYSTAASGAPLMGQLQNQIVKDETGRLVQTDKREVGIAAADLPSGVIPAKSDQVEINGQIYEVLAIRPDSAQGEVYRYRLEVQA
jgi:hypothetical protein